MESRCLKLDPSFEDDISHLYLSAFPDDERPPLDWFYKCLYKYKENEVIGYFDENEFIGFVEITTYKDIIYIVFFAIIENKRNQGYGTKILSDIKEKYSNFTILLCYEEVSEKYPDYENRKHRQDFYLRNGFIDNEMKTREGDVVYQSAYIGKCKVSFEEYQNIFDLCYGTGASKTYLREYKNL